MKIFITGKPGTGKTTLVLKIAEELKKKGLKVGGFFTQDIRVNQERKGFKIKNFETGEEGILAHVNQPQGPQVSKYRVNIHDLEEIGVKAVESAVAKDWIVVDEIGKMELQSTYFEETIKRLVDSNKNILATVHWSYEHPLILKIKKDYNVYFLSKVNSSGMFKEILKQVNPACCGV